MRITRFSLGVALFTSFAVIAFANDKSAFESRAANYLGIPGVDFPVLDAVPVTAFKCDLPGYYGDVDARCQVFHICQADGRHDSFLCPNGTLFNQKFLVCDWWFNVDCSGAPSLYSRNADIFPKEASNVVAVTTARWQDEPELKQKPDGVKGRYGSKRVSVNRMGGAAASIPAAGLDAFNSDESTTILPAEEELGVPLQLDLVEDPGVTVAVATPPADANTDEDATAEAVTDAPRRPARPSTYGRKGQSLIALSQSGQVGEPAELFATSTQVSPIDSPATVSSPTTEQYRSEPLQSDAAAPSRTLEPPAVVFFASLDDVHSTNTSASPLISENSSTIDETASSFAQIDSQSHLSASAASVSISSSLKREKQQPIKTGGVKHLNGSSKFGSRVGKKAHKSLLQ